MLRLLIPFALLLAPGVDAAWGADVLVAGGYIETPELLRFARSFGTPGALAICTDALAAQSPKVKVTGCELERCPEEGCAPGQCRSPRDGWRQIEFHSECGASAFLLGIGGLKAGPVRSATPDTRNRVVGHMEGYRFRFSDRHYLVRVASGTTGSGQPTARLEVLRDGEPYSVLLEQDAHKMDCGVNWMGDLNSDGEPDLVVACFRNIYEQVFGLFLSRKGQPGRYEFIRQRVVGGSL